MGRWQTIGLFALITAGVYLVFPSILVIIGGVAAYLAYTVGRGQRRPRR